ncbi:MAG: pyruvate, water dikinase [Deltaproteobacteria bacterium]|nr:pyruvate, water dikinase [Deltaproteobacteria bacterium]
MNRIIRRLKDFFSEKQQLDATEIEALRNDFQSRYHHFKLLLNANNKALEIMSEMEDALKGTQPFGMTFVRSRCTSVSTNVWQIVKHLNELAQGKYEALYERFKTIQTQINPFLKYHISTPSGPLVIPLDSVNKDMLDQVGSKMASLGEIATRMNLAVSNGFAITAQAYWRFMEHNDLQPEINRLLQTAEMENPDQLYRISAAIQQRIMQASLPPDLETAIWEQYKWLEQLEGKGMKVALRSSALGEDMSGASFAGQYRSVLNVSNEHILYVYKEIVASKYSPTAMTYRLNRGMRDESIAMCVGCLSMVDAVSGGVVYSENPLEFQEKTIVISSVWGLPKPVVDGSSAVDLYILSRKDPITIIQKDIAFKDQKFVCYANEGVCRMDMTGDISDLPSLTDEQALSLAQLALRLEGYYGTPQDVEWALKRDGSIVVLQCRPLQQAKSRAKRMKDRMVEPDLKGILLQGGFTASSGVAAGPVYKVQKDMDLLQFPKGAIMVTAQALPRWAAVLNRAGAVVTSQGSITGHLANVAREFGVPAIFGMNKIFDRLENDHIITVDADRLCVYEGRREDLLEKKPRLANLMEGSPIFEALRGVSRYIVPLNLIDPASPEFKVNGCRTFHDITRFCHEKVVDEMFQFGKEHHFPERSSKQLFVKVPMQWWVLNLDDGFNKEIEGKFVHLEDIASIPMLALWEGIVAFPWEGPPPVDGKGFMSVMFQATTNPALVNGVRSKYGDRNYFMISKNYCSLSSRLGFHFSTIETLVSDRSSENYISFQFKGGAADENRRIKRVAFIKEILEAYGFRVDISEDNLIARLEGYEEDYMKTRLKILGYLTIHTRQLDMIMASDSRVRYYREKIREALARLTEIYPS